MDGKTSIRASILEIFLHDLDQAYMRLCSLGFSNVLDHILFDMGSCFVRRGCTRFSECAAVCRVHLSVVNLLFLLSDWQSLCFVVVDVLCLVPQ